MALAQVLRYMSFSRYIEILTEFVLKSDISHINLWYDEAIIFLLLSGLSLLFKTISSIQTTLFFFFSIHLIVPKWPLFQYSLARMQIAPCRLILKLKTQRIILAWLRQEGQKQNEWPNWSISHFKTDKGYEFPVKFMGRVQPNRGWNIWPYR